MADNQFQNTVEALFRGMDGYISSKTVIGEPIYVHDTAILPLMDVSFGMGAGAWHRSGKESASGGMGGKLSPSAVLVIKDGAVRVVNVSSSDPVSKVIDMAPDIINRFTGGRKTDPEVEEVIENIRQDAQETGNE